MGPRALQAAMLEAAPLPGAKLFVVAPAGFLGAWGWYGLGGGCELWALLLWGCRGAAVRSMVQ